MSDDHVVAKLITECSVEFTTNPSQEMAAMASLMTGAAYGAFGILSALSRIPEGPTISYQEVRDYYSGIRTAAIFSLNQLRHIREIEAVPLDDPRKRSEYRMEANLLLISSLAPVEGEEKSEIYRMYDQTRRGIISGVEREIKILLNQKAG